MGWGGVGAPSQLWQPGIAGRDCEPSVCSRSDGGVNVEFAASNASSAFCIVHLFEGGGSSGVGSLRRRRRRRPGLARYGRRSSRGSGPEVVARFAAACSRRSKRAVVTGHHLGWPRRQVRHRVDRGGAGGGTSVCCDRDRSVQSRDVLLNPACTGAVVVGESCRARCFGRAPCSSSRMCLKSKQSTGREWVVWLKGKIGVGMWRAYVCSPEKTLRV